jgi:crotonobetainyl-CoA:carnitine CoA-transferase CaiB-like acyl-CoA transferase
LIFLNPSGPTADTARWQTLDDPQVKAREMIVEMEHRDPDAHPASEGELS